MARVPIGNVTLKNRALNVGYAQWCDRRSGGSKAPVAGAAESATRPMTIFSFAPKRKIARAAGTI